MTGDSPGRGAQTSRPYRGVPTEERKADRRQRLVDAGLELFGTRGIHATRIDDLCAEAGLTKRYFYESFASLDDLVAAVVDHVVGEVALVVVPAIVEHGWRTPRPVLEAFMGALLADPRYIHLLVVETHNGALYTKRQELLETAVDLWLEADPHTVRDPEVLPTQRLLAHAMGGAAGEVALAWLNGRIDLSAEEVVDHLVRIFERITPRAPRAGSPKHS